MRLYKSVENVIFDGIDLADRFSRGNGYFIVNDVRGRAYRPTSVDMRTVPNKAGGFAGPLRTGPRTIEIDFTLKGDTYEELRKILEEFNALVLKDGTVPLRFTDEPDRTYYGKVSGVQKTLERSRIHKGTITVVCEDPYKYGMTKRIGGLSVQNNGTVETPFILETEIAEPSTYLRISDGKETFALGKQNSSGQFSESLLFHDEMKSMNGWSTFTGIFNDYTQGGDIVSDLNNGGYYKGIFRLVNVTSSIRQGKSVVKAVGASSDFRIETVFDTLDNGQFEGRVYVVLIDHFENELARIGIETVPSNSTNRIFIRIGDEMYNQVLIDTTGLGAFSYPNFYGKLVLEKSDTKIKASIIRLDKETGVEIAVEETVFYFDYLGNYFTNPFVATVVHLGVSVPAETFENSYMGVADIKVFNFVDINASNPYIVQPGDDVKVDMEKRQVFINGAIKNAYKSIDSSYFNLSTGVSTLAVTPPNIAKNLKITFRERFL